jgi:Right handed beta helix region
MNKVADFIILLSALAIPAAATDLFVATTGDDNAAGTAQAPYRTLYKAKAVVQQVISSVTGPINVWVRGGIYYLDSALTFTPADGGSASTPITYSAYRGEKVIISGGIKVMSAWTTSSGNIMVTTIAPNLKVDQLFLNGARQILARYPNYDSNSVNSLNGTQSDVLGATRVAKWGNPAEGPGYIRGLQTYDWGGESFIITGKSGSTTTQKWVGDNNRGQGLDASHCIVENILEELDAPGEWYYKKPTGQLFFYPPAGTNLSSATIELASLDELIRVVGTSATKVRYLTFNRLTFMHTFRTLFSPSYQPYELLLRSDWGIARAGALFIRDAENVTVKHCFFDQIGGNGVFMSGYNRNHLVYNNVFTNIGASCILSIGLQSAVRTPSTWSAPINTITDNTPGPLTTDYPQNITIDNNLMTTMGVFEKQACGIGISMSSQVTVRHNSVSIAPRAGINFCDGCWGGHLIEYNDVSNCVRETGDHGPLNAWGRDRFWSVPNPTKQMALLDAMSTTIIRKNRFQDNNGRGYFGVDLDDGSSNYQVSQNLCLSCGVKFREGFVRRSINNIMINGQQHCHVWLNGGSDSVYHNIIVNASPYDPVTPNFAGDQAYIDCNDFWNNGGSVDISPTTSAGLDAHSVKADPKFTNAAAGNYGVAPGSPALTLCSGGFINFPMDSFGRMNVTPDTNQPATVGVIPAANGAKMSSVRSVWLGRRLVIQYELANDARVSVTLYSIDGKNIAVLSDKQEKAGFQTIAWNANAAATRPLSPGMYLVKMKFGDRTETQKIVSAK